MLDEGERGRRKKLLGVSRASSDSQRAKKTG